MGAKCKDCRLNFHATCITHKIYFHKQFKEKRKRRRKKQTGNDMNHMWFSGLCRHICKVVWIVWPYFKVKIHLMALIYFMPVLIIWFKWFKRILKRQKKLKNNKKKYLKKNTSPYEDHDIPHGLFRFVATWLQSGTHGFCF